MRLGISSDLGAGHDRLVTLLSAGQVHAAEQTGRSGAVLAAYDQGWHATLLTGAVVVLLGALAAFALVGRPSLAPASHHPVTVPEGSPA
jgi:hypothetical protein